MSRSRFISKKHFLYFVFFLIVVDVVIVGVFNYMKDANNIDLSFSTPFTDFYNYQPAVFHYIVVNKARGRTPNNVNLKLEKCDDTLKRCAEIWQKKTVLKPKEILKDSGEFMDKTMTDFGLKKLVMTATDFDNNVLAQKNLIVNLKNFSDELFINLQPDRDLVATGDYVRLNYIIANRSGMTFPKKDFALSLNYAGPVEIMQNTGRLIEDLSQDIIPGQTITGQGVWVTNEYVNRQGGAFNVSLNLSYRENGSLKLLTDMVKTVQWP